MKAELKIPHIVLADEDVNECLLFKNALDILHVPFIVSIANNSETLLSMLDAQDFHPDFVFLDLHMYGSSGEECLETLKTKKSLDRVPIILFSGSGNPGDIDYCYNTTANEYFLNALHFLL